MQVAPSELTRRLVPRWRSLSRTPISELENYRESQPISPVVLEELRVRVARWKSERDEFAAQNLTWASTVFGVNELNAEALREIATDNAVPPDTRAAAASILNHGDGGSVDLTLDVPGTREFLIKSVRELRRHLHDQTHNPIVWVELGRLYSQLGQSDAAERALLAACALAPSDRYVLRAASRFFVHVGRLDRALHLLKRGDPSDPWIQASKISISDLANVKIPDIKRVRAILERDISPKHLSELASSLATLEYGYGNVSKSKKLFKISAVDPNDNVVAQLQWASRKKIIPFKEKYLERALTFEARTFAAKKDKRWKEAVNHCLQWLHDEPFSVRPAGIGSFIAAEFMMDYDTSIEFASFGLLANPDDFLLLNNLAFSQIGRGDLEKAAKTLELARARAESNEEQIVLLATTGMLDFRQGKIDEGSAAYLQAIEKAISSNERELGQLATIHYYAEYARLGSFLSQVEVRQIQGLIEAPGTSPDVKNVFHVLLEPLLPNEAWLQPPQAILKPPLEQLLTTAVNEHDSPSEKKPM